MAGSPETMGFMGGGGGGDWNSFLEISWESNGPTQKKYHPTGK